MVDKAEFTLVPNTHPLIPPGWDESAGFRETFLFHFQQPGDDGSLRHLARKLHESELEIKPFVPQTSGSITRQELRAAAADLRHLQGFLGAIVRSWEDGDLAPEDSALAALAAGQARVVAEVAAVLERALG